MRKRRKGAASQKEGHFDQALKDMQDFGEISGEWRWEDITE